MGNTTKGVQRKLKPALTPEDREQQMIFLAESLAEKQLREGTASPMVIKHYLALGTTRAEYEKEKLKNENLLLQAKADKIRSEQDAGAKYDEVIKAFMTYSGHPIAEEDDEEEEL